jgi:hypothetical protein
MAAFRIDEQAPVLVELTAREGTKKAGITLDDMADRSAVALDNAMNTIHHMARRVVDTVDSLMLQPSEIELSFGLKLTTEGMALITGGGEGNTINVKLKWQEDILNNLDDIDSDDEFGPFEEIEPNDEV